MTFSCKGEHNFSALVSVAGSPHHPVPKSRQKREVEQRFAVWILWRFYWSSGNEGRFQTKSVSTKPKSTREGVYSLLSFSLFWFEKNRGNKKVSLFCWLKKVWKTVRAKLVTWIRCRKVFNPQKANPLNSLRSFEKTAESESRLDWNKTTTFA